MLSDSEITALVGRIVARFDPQKVIVFGSYAKGTFTSKSDLDVLVVRETDVPIANRADELNPLLASMLVHVDLHIHTPEELEAYGGEEFSFASSVLRTGKVVYQRL